MGGERSSIVCIVGPDLRRRRRRRQCARESWIAVQ